MMLKSMLACCKMYISESRNKVALESIDKGPKLCPEAPIINKFEDLTYNRVVYTLVSKLTPKPSHDPCSLKIAALATRKAAKEALILSCTVEIILSSEL